MRRTLQTWLSLSLILSLGLTACGKKEREPVAEQELLTRCQAAVAAATISLVNDEPVKDVSNETISMTLQPYTLEALPEDCVAQVSVSFSDALTGQVTEMTTFLGLERYRRESDLVSTACVHTPDMPISPEHNAACWDAQQPQTVYVRDANGQLRPVRIRHSQDGNQFTSPGNAAATVDFADRIEIDFPELIFVPLNLGTLSSPLVDANAFFERFDQEVPVYVPPPPPPELVQPPAAVAEPALSEQTPAPPEYPPPPDSTHVPEAASTQLIVIIPPGQTRTLTVVGQFSNPAVFTREEGLRSDALRVREIFERLLQAEKPAWYKFWQEREHLPAKEISIRGGGAPIHFDIITSLEVNSKPYYACYLEATRTDSDQMVEGLGDINFPVYLILADELDHVSVLDQEGQVIPSASQVLNTFHRWQAERPFSEKGRAIVVPRQFVPNLLEQNLYTSSQLDAALVTIAPYQQTVPGYLVDEQGFLHPIDVPLGIAMTDDHSLGWGLDGTWPGNGGSNIHFRAYLPFEPFSLNPAISDVEAAKFFATIKEITGQEQPPVVDLIVNTSDVMILDLVTPFTK